jgi:hypothetical protein
MPMDVAFGKPADYFAVPTEERSRRCALTSDWCSIEPDAFYIRGCLEVPVVNPNEPFVWGLWVPIGEPDFQRYLPLYDSDGSQEPPFHGYLCGEHRGHEGLEANSPDEVPTASTELTLPT